MIEINIIILNIVKIKLDMENAWKVNIFGIYFKNCKLCFNHARIQMTQILDARLRMNVKVYKTIECSSIHTWR